MQLKTLKTHLMAFLKDEEGASGIEYALVAAMVAVALVAFVPGVSTAIGNIFGAIEDELTGVDTSGV